MAAWNYGCNVALLVTFDKSYLEAVMFTSFALSIALLAGPTVGHVQPAPYVTKRGYVFCTTLNAFNTQSKLLVSGDREAWTKYMTNPINGCASLKEGIPVYMENAKGIGIVKIRREGETDWVYTNTEAVRRA